VSGAVATGPGDTLLRQNPLASRHDDHAFASQHAGKHECHVAPDWLLIYRVDATASELILVRTGSHSDLF